MKNDANPTLNIPLEFQSLFVAFEAKHKEEIEILEEQIRLLRAQLFGRTSEKNLEELPLEQLPLFKGSELEEIGESEPETIEVPAHSRKKSGRKQLPENLPHIDVVHDISDEEKQCQCGAEMCRMGEEIYKQLDLIPAQMTVIRNIRPKYVCKSCEGLEAEGKVVKIAPPPPQMIPKSIASANLLASMITAKFVDAIPFYRQEKQFSRLGVDIPRSLMAS